MCGKRFIVTADLRRHMKTYTRKKKYICNVCGQRFPSRSNLVTHLKTHITKKQHAYIGIIDTYTVISAENIT